MQKNGALSDIRRVSAMTACAFLLLSNIPAWAENYVITIKDHQFTPGTLVLPANQKIKLIVRNDQSIPAEFESTELNREKVVPPNSEVTVILGPLDPGTYGYLDDFHRDTTGTITAK